MTTTQSIKNIALALIAGLLLTVPLLSQAGGYKGNREILNVSPAGDRHAQHQVRHYRHGHGKHYGKHHRKHHRGRHHYGRHHKKHRYYGHRRHHHRHGYGYGYGHYGYGRYYGYGGSYGRISGVYVAPGIGLHFNFHD